MSKKEEYWDIPAAWSIQHRLASSSTKARVTGHIFNIQGSEIQTIQEQRIWCLRKQYDSSLKDTGNLTNTKDQLNTWLNAIEQSQLLGRFKVWCFQYGIIPHLQWPFLLYVFPVSQVEEMEILCSKCPHDLAQSTCRVRPPSFSQGQSVHSSHLKMLK